MKPLKNPAVFLVLSIALLLPLHTWAQEEPLSLQEAIQIGLQQNFSIQIANREALAATNNVTLGNAGFLPQVNAQLNRNFRSEDARQIFLTGQTQERENARSNSLNSSVNLNWVIFDGMGMFINRQRLQAQRNNGILLSKGVIENTIANITNAYFEVVRQGSKIPPLEEAIRISEERINLSQAQYEVGVAAKIVIQTAQVDYNADRSELLRQKENLRNAQITLNEILGRAPETPLFTTDSLLLLPDFPVQNIASMSLDQNMVLQQAQLRQELAHLELRSLRATRYPVIGITSSYVFTRSESQADFLLENRRIGFNYGLTVALNIFNGFNTNRLLQNARLFRQNAEVEYKQLQNNVQSDMQRALSRYQNRLEILDLEEANLVLARQNTDIALERYKLGFLTALELREAQRSQLLAENRLIDILYEAKQAETELRRLGGFLLQDGV